MTLKMTTAQVVETSVTVTNSSFQNYTHPDDHTTQTTDTPGFKPFTIYIVYKYTVFTVNCVCVCVCIYIYIYTHTQYIQNIHGSVTFCILTNTKVTLHCCIFIHNIH